MDYFILIPILVPIIGGLILLLDSLIAHLSIPKEKVTNGRIHETVSERWRIHIFSLALQAVGVISAIVVAFSGDWDLTLFPVVDGICLHFHIDALGRLFLCGVCLVWMLISIYGVSYMKHEGEERRFYGYMNIVFGVLVGLNFSGNVITLYVFYEIMTLASFPLVLHNQTREAIMGSLKYLFYSLTGAYMGLFGIFVLYRYCNSLEFVPGGNLNMGMVMGHEGIVLAAAFVMILGFSAKAGMFPLHAWLPSAHPVAPSPASAVLSGALVKAGVFAVARCMFYMIGHEFISGTWVQTCWSIFSLITVFMGSLLAFREPVIKKRFAYSTVSQISYIIFGLSMMNHEALDGAFAHTVFHSIIKSGLFLMAGTFIFCEEATTVEDLRGIGKRMPVAMTAYTVLALGLVGIPPTAGFISKWYLCLGALHSGIPFFNWFGPLILLISALLTAGYLFPIFMVGFFPGKDYKVTNKKEPPLPMLIPIVVFALLTLLFGLFPDLVFAFIKPISNIIY